MMIAGLGLATMLSGTTSSALAATPPTVTTTAATPITATSAVLNGQVNPDKGATRVYFEWGSQHLV